MINSSHIQEKFDRKEKIELRRKKSKGKHIDHTKGTNSIREKLQLGGTSSKKNLEKRYTGHLLK